MSVLVGMVINAVLNWLAKFFADHLAAYERDKANHEKAVNQATHDMKKAEELKPESSKEQVDEAIDDIFKKL